MKSIASHFGYYPLLFLFLTIFVIAHDAPAQQVVLACEGVGTGGDRADLRGIRFTVDRDFSTVELRLGGSVAGSYQFDAELRRSNGFVGNPLASVSVEAELPDIASEPPYGTVTLAFGSVEVDGDQSFTLKLTNISTPGPGTQVMFIEVHTDGATCDQSDLTNQNSGADPTVRGNDPAGLRVLAEEPPDVLSSFTSTPPVLDGKINWGEWSDAGRFDFEHGSISVLNDAARLYILINVLQDTSNDAGDFFWLSFDVNRDGQITPDVDLNYARVPQSGNMRYQLYTGPGSWTGLQPVTRSAKARGFGCFFADGTLRPQVRGGLVCNRHRVWELGVDLAEIGAEAGGATRMGLRVTSENPSFTERIPPNFTSSFADLLAVELAPARRLGVSPTPLALERFEERPIEVTQAIQDRDNSVPLVADKDTVARLYVEVDGADSAQPTVVYLYGSDDGVDLPGSPLCMTHDAPLTIDREEISDTANFLLPASWDDARTISLQGAVLDSFGNQDTAPAQSVTFSSRDTPTYWVVPINTGSESSPFLPSDAEIASQQQYTETIFPVSGIRWVRKPWEDIGVTNVSSIIDDLNDYASTALLAWVFGLILTGEEPFEFPDQIYGFAPSGGGISDPLWCGTNGLVSRGFRGTSREGTLAHEINHNLDRDLSGTWGRHTPFGCNAPGPDPTWPYSDDNIQEVGFDTRRPWVDGTGTQDTVIPASYPDFMSYCQSDDLVGNPFNQLPTKWISPYRWDALFDIPFNKAQGKGLPDVQIEDVYYITGSVHRDGTGILKPILAQPGTLTGNIQPSEYDIQVVDGNGGQLSRVPFPVSFMNVEGEQVEQYGFNLRIAQQAGAAEIRLRKDGVILDVVNVSPNSPRVTVQVPNGGEEWAGREVIQWEANDADGDDLEFTVFFSADNGKTWRPLACRLREQSYTIDTRLLEGTEAGRVRVLATDGVNTSEDSSDEPFVVLPNPPEVQILAPVNNSRVGSGVLVEFRGDATDPEDGPLPEESLVWSYNGNVFGMGREVSAILPEGVHDVTLEATDSDGQVNTKTVAVFAVDLEAEDVVIRSLRLTNPGEFTIWFSGRDGIAVEIQASTDLQKWDRVDELTLFNGVGVFRDPSAGETGKRFYRAVELP